MPRNRLLLKHALVLPYPPPKYQATGNENMKQKLLNAKEGRAQSFPGEKSVQWHGAARRMPVCPEAAPAPETLSQSSECPSEPELGWIPP